MVSLYYCVDIRYYHRRNSLSDGCYMDRGGESATYL